MRAFPPAFALLVAASGFILAATEEASSNKDDIPNVNFVDCKTSMSRLEDYGWCIIMEFDESGKVEYVGLNKFIGKEAEVESQLYDDHQDSMPLPDEPLPETVLKLMAGDTTVNNEDEFPKVQFVDCDTVGLDLYDRCIQMELEESGKVEYLGLKKHSGDHSDLDGQLFDDHLNLLPCQNRNESGRCLDENRRFCSSPHWRWVRDDCKKLCDVCEKASICQLDVGFVYEGSKNGKIKNIPSAESCRSRCDRNGISFFTYWSNYRTCYCKKNRNKRTRHGSNTISGIAQGCGNA